MEVGVEKMQGVGLRQDMLTTSSNADAQIRPMRAKMGVKQMLLSERRSCYADTIRQLDNSVRRACRIQCLYMYIHI